MNFLDLIWLIPILPLCGAAIMLFFGRNLPKAAIRVISPGAVGLSFLLSLGAVVQLASLPEKVHQVILFQWLPLLHADMGYLLDPAGMGEEIAELWQDLRDAALATLPGWARDLYGYPDPPPVTPEKSTWRSVVTSPPSWPARVIGMLSWLWRFPSASSLVIITRLLWRRL